MGNIVQNLFFHSILILLVGGVAWFFYTDQPNKIKFSILNHFIDLLFYFLFAAFGTNVVFNFREIIAVPYQAVIFSSNVLTVATFIITVYIGIVYGERFWTQADKMQSAIHLFLFMGLVNHIYLYFIYSRLQSIIFIGFYIILLGLTSSFKYLSKIDPLLILLGAGLIHFLLMGDGAVLYFNFAIYRGPFLIILVTLTSILYLQRRKLQSKQT